MAGPRRSDPYGFFCGFESFEEDGFAELDDGGLDGSGFFSEPDEPVLGLLTGFGGSAAFCSWAGGFDCFGGSGAGRSAAGFGG